MWSIANAFQHISSRLWRNCIGNVGHGYTNKTKYITSGMMWNIGLTN